MVKLNKIFFYTEENGKRYKQSMSVGDRWKLGDDTNITIESFCPGSCACIGKCIRGRSDDGVPMFWNFQGHGESPPIVAKIGKKE